METRGNVNKKISFVCMHIFENKKEDGPRGCMKLKIRRQMKEIIGIHATDRWFLKGKGGYTRMRIRVLSTRCCPATMDIPCGK